MLDFGFSEVIVTSMIALVVLGPKRLPGVMRKMGNWVGRARVMARQLSDQLEREINAEEILREAQKRPATPAATPAPPAVPATPAAPAAAYPEPLMPDVAPAPAAAAAAVTAPAAATPEGASAPPPAPVP